VLSEAALGGAGEQVLARVIRTTSFECGSRAGRKHSRVVEGWALDPPDPAAILNDPPPRLTLPRAPPATSRGRGSSDAEADVAIGGPVRFPPPDTNRDGERWRSVLRSGWTWPVSAELDNDRTFRRVAADRYRALRLGFVGGEGGVDLVRRLDRLSERGGLPVAREY